MKNNHCPLVSVVITTKNEGKNIGDCLQSILDQTYKNIEIIVVDNHSSDNTVKRLKQLKTRFAESSACFARRARRVENGKLKIYTKGPERSAQRNYGAINAKGEYYLYLDADMTLSVKVIEECVKKIKSLAGLYIPEIIRGNSFWSKVRRFERSFYNATVIDCVRFIPLNLFHKIKGFDEDMSGPEDWDFDKKVRQLGKVDIIKSPLFHNESNFNLKKYLDKKSYYIKSFDRYINKWGKDDIDIKKQFGFCYRYCGVFVEKGKWLQLISHPVLAIGMFLLKFLVGSRYIMRKLI